MLRIMQADIGVLDSKIERLDNKIDSLSASMHSEIKVLDNKIDSLSASVQSDIKRLDDKISQVDDKISQVVSMTKWGVGMFVSILLAIAALAVISLFR